MMDIKRCEFGIEPPPTCPYCHYSIVEGSYELTPVCQFVCPSVCLCVCNRVCLSNISFMCLSVYLPVCLSVCLFVFVSVLLWCVCSWVFLCWFLFVFLCPCFIYGPADWYCINFVGFVSEHQQKSNRARVAGAPSVS